MIYILDIVFIFFPIMMRHTNFFMYDKKNWNPGHSFPIGTFEF